MQKQAAMQVATKVPQHPLAFAVAEKACIKVLETSMESATPSHCPVGNSRNGLGLQDPEKQSMAARLAHMKGCPNTSESG